MIHHLLKQKAICYFYNHVISVQTYIYNVGGEEIKDVKIYYRDRFEQISHDYKNSKLPFVSTDDESFLTLEKELLKDKFKNKTKYEK